MSAKRSIFSATKSNLKMQNPAKQATFYHSAEAQNFWTAVKSDLWESKVKAGKEVAATSIWHL